MSDSILDKRETFEGELPIVREDLGERIPGVPVVTQKVHCRVAIFGRDKR